MSLIEQGVKKFANELEEKRYIIEANLRRRQLNSFQRIELTHMLEPIERELARIRQKAGLKQFKSLGAPSGSGEPHGRVPTILAKKADVSPSTYKRARVILDHGDDELKQKCRSSRIRWSRPVLFD